MSRACIVAAFVLLAALVTAAPAQATYRDVATSYGTVADVKANGDEIPAADVPDGSYRNIEVRTSSSFCKVTNCTVKKSGSQMTATFTLTRTYTALFLGTAEEAAAATDEAGEDYGAYIMGDEVTVGKTRLMRFSMPVSAFNAPISIASFNGGSTSFTKACWYDRSIMFDSNSEVTMAVSAGTGPKGSDDGDDDGGDDADKDGNGRADEGDDEPADTKGGSADDADSDDEGDADADADADGDGDADDDADEPEEADGEPADEYDDDDDDATAQSAAAAAGSAGTGSGGGGSGGSSADTTPAQQDGTAQQGAEGAGAAGAGIPATPLHFASIDLSDDEPAPQGEAAVEESAQAPALPATQLVAAGMFAVLLAGGIAVQVLRFRRALGAAMTAVRAAPVA